MTCNLTGQWTALWEHEGDGKPPSGAIVTLSETVAPDWRRNVIEGAVANQTPPMFPCSRLSTLQGVHGIMRVVFEQTCQEGGNRCPRAMGHDGTVSNDGNTITGTWSGMGGAQGTFIMQRRTESGAKEKQEPRQRLVYMQNDKPVHER